MILAALRPWQLSFLVHATLVLAFLVLTFLKLPESDVYEVPIQVNAPQEVQNLTEVKEKPKVVLKSVNEPIPESKPSREIFGANRNSYTDESQGAEGVEIKKGNTLAKEVDSTRLEDSDADSLPTPTEEYLVSEMPSVLSEVRPVYPKEARDKQLEGTVALDVLIDEKGLVRQVNVIEGLNIFRQAAMNAMKSYKFRPAKVDGKSVAVRIRYSINFQLEY
jgi:TonB family protein